MSVVVRAMEKEKIGPSFEDPTEDDYLSDEEGKFVEKSDIKKPGLHDVLLGRGGGTNNHTGNVTFRQLVNKHKMRYLACSKVDKPKVAREVVQLWRKMDPPGRFLQRKDETKRGPGSVKDENIVWVEVGDKKAREKASQCLRERTADVLPYLSQLRQHQDHMTEQGVSMVQQQMQMTHPNSMGHNNPITGNMNPSARRGSIMNMPDRPTHINSMNRRGSMPVVTTASMPVTPTNMQTHSRRTSLPAVSHLQGQQPQQLEMQQLMAHQQQVLREAYTVIERSGGMNPQRIQMLNQQILAERQAIMQQQQQYSNFDGPMMQNNMMQNSMMHQNQMMRNNMMHQNQMMQNNMGTSPEMSPTHQHRSVNENYAHMAAVNRSPTDMNNVNQCMAQQQQMAKNRSPVPRTTASNHVPLPVKNITVTIGGEDDLEPLPYANEDDEPIPLSMVPDAPKSAAPTFVSPNVASRSDKVDRKQSQNRPLQNHHQQQAADQNKRRLQQDETSNMVQRTATNHNQEVEYIDLQPLPLDLEEDEEETYDKGQQQQEDQTMLENNQGRGGGQAGDAEITLREYRKTLEDYITNHQISTPAVDIDDDVSEEGLGFDGIDASAWIQQALNDSGDLSLTNRKNGGRRGVLKEHRENSKKSLMSTDGTSYMSLALSDMEQTDDHSEDLSTREQKMSGARSMASNHSVMSELTDFSELDL